MKLAITSVEDNSVSTSDALTNRTSRLPAVVELRLLARLKRKFDLTSTTIELHGQPYSWLQVCDPDKLLEQALMDRNRSAADVDPFWAAHWRASIGLERFLDSLPIRGERILEMGCGSGRAGIGAALRGAHVTLTDAVGSALLVARYNGRFAGSKLSFRRLEWSEGNLHQKFPWILGSDIVYDPALHPILEPCLRRHLDANGVVLLSEPQRHTGDRFRRWILSAGWRLREHFINLNDGHRPIRIFELRLDSLPHECVARR